VNSGFRQTEAKRAIEVLFARHDNPSPIDPETLIREALAILT
jgi:hypothetical protein